MKISQHLKSFWVLLLLGGVMFVYSCSDVKVEVDQPYANAHQFDKTVYLDWNNTFLEIERYAPGYRPGPAPRALAYLGLSAYEAVVTAIPENNSLASLYPDLQIPRPDPALEYNWAAVVNASYSYLMERFFFHMENTHPQLFGLIEKTYLKFHNIHAGSTSDEVLSRSEEYGRQVAAAVYAWESLDDKGHNAFLEKRPVSYNPPAGPGKWQPTFPDYAKAVFPYWGQVRRFAMKDEDILARPPLPYSENENSLYYTQGLEVYNTVQNINNSGPGAYEGRWIGEFWSDDIDGLTFGPPSRLIAILNQVADKENLDLAQCAEAYAMMGMALHDNGVAIWHSKYYYNVERPVDFIRRVISSKYPDAANWTSILNDPVVNFQGVTPSFPAYPSGHSGFGGAGAKVLSALFEFTPEHPGTYTFTDICHIYRTEFIGTPRTFPSFRNMGEEDAYSRIPLGVHFRMDCDEGLRIGDLAAQRVLELPWKK